MKTISSETRLIRTLTHLLQREDHFKLVFKGQRHTKEIGISRGQILYATSNLLKDKLSEILFKSGKLTHDQFMLSTELSIVTKKRFGEILINEGFVTKEDVVQGLRYQANKIIQNLFEFPDWKMKITDYTPDVPPDITPQLYLFDGLVAGVRSIDNLTILYESLPEKNEILEIFSEQPPFMKTIEFTREEILLLHLFDGHRTLQQVQRESKMLEYRFYKTLYPLLALKVIEVQKKPAKVQMPEHLHLPSAQPFAESGSNEIFEMPSGQDQHTHDHQALFEEARILIAAEEYTVAANKLKRLIRQNNKRSDYYYYLGLALDHIPSQNKEAERALKTAIRLQNYNARYYLALGYLYLKRNMTRQAKEQFRTALKWEPDDRYVKEALKRLENQEKKGPGFLPGRLFRKSG